MMPSLNSTPQQRGGTAQSWQDLQNKAFQISGGAMGAKPPQAPQLPSPPPGGWQVMNSGGMPGLNSTPQATSRPNMSVYAPQPPASDFRVMDGPDNPNRLVAWPSQSQQATSQPDTQFRPLPPGPLRSVDPRILQEQQAQRQRELDENIRRSTTPGRGDQSAYIDQITAREQGRRPTSDPRANLQPPTMPTPRPMPQNPGMAQPIQPPSQGTPYTPPEIRRPAQTWTQQLREYDAMQARQPQAANRTPPFSLDPRTGSRQPQFSASYGGMFGGPSFSTPNFAQRDALIQRLNDNMLPYQLGQRTGAPQFNIPQLFGQANQMVASGWRNPFAMR